ncbi:MAG TPA: hypothetical protein VJB14_17650 [Planctomycetota bacterium]|nr:hypothetical protein [Planctomycetota bacterium]
MEINLVELERRVRIISPKVDGISKYDGRIAVQTSEALTNEEADEILLNMKSPPHTLKEEPADIESDPVVVDKANL